MKASGGQLPGCQDCQIHDAMSSLDRTDRAFAGLDSSCFEAQVVIPCQDTGTAIVMGKSDACTRDSVGLRVVLFFSESIVMCCTLDSRNKAVR